MIKLIDQELSASTLAELAKYQMQINNKVGYAEQVAEAQNLWRPQNKTFDEITSSLIAMCPGTRRCCYCEDARGEDIEHFRPKNLYPDVAFEWKNYLFACSACNSNVKRNKFAVIDDTGILRDVTRPRSAPVLPPITGLPALINPRFEDPLEYLRIDLLRNYYFLPRQGLATVNKIRAKYTIEVLQLNIRDDLVQWRKDSYRAFIGWIDTYKRYKTEGHLQRLNEHVKNLRRYNHLAVWEEMKRIYRERDLTRWDDLKKRHDSILELDTLFTTVPEILKMPSRGGLSLSLSLTPDN